MSSITRTTEKNLMVFTGRAHPDLAEEVAALLGPAPALARECLAQSAILAEDVVALEGRRLVQHLVRRHGGGG